MKKIAALFLAVMLSVSLAACGSTNTDQSQQVSSTTDSASGGGGVLP